MKKIIKAVFVFFVAIAVLNTLFGGRVKKDSKNDNNREPVAEEQTDSGTVNLDSDWLKDYSDQGVEVFTVPADVLYSYGQAYAEQVVVTAFPVESISNDMLKATTENNDTYSFSIVSEFNEKEEISKIKENDQVIVVGTVKKDPDYKLDFLGSGQTVIMENCHLVTKGITVEEIEQSREQQNEYGKTQIAALQQQKIEEAEANKESYINQCETVDYADVERNPNQYKGKQIYVSGSVIQVSEGLFNSVTLRVDQGGGNCWYVTYTRKDENESRILEGDWLTFYGECDGVTTYTNIVGSKVTIPALDAEYYK